MKRPRFVSAGLEIDLALAKLTKTPWKKLVESNAAICLESIQAEIRKHKIKARGLRVVLEVIE